VGLERGPLSLVNNLRSYLEEIVAVPGLENRSYDRRDSLRWLRDTLYPLKLALASLIGGDRSIGIVRYRTKNHGGKMYRISILRYSVRAPVLPAECICRFRIIFKKHRLFTHVRTRFCRVDLVCSEAVCSSETSIKFYQPTQRYI
jgi:hypothetical protein